MNRLQFWNTAYWSCFGIYVLSFFLPSMSEINMSIDDIGPKAESLPGYVCAYFSIVFMFAGGNFLLFIGNFANLSVLVGLLLRLPLLQKTNAFVIGGWLLLGMAVTGFLIWLAIVPHPSLLIGYYVWGIACAALAIAQLQYRLALRATALESAETNDVSEHLIQN